MARNNQKIKAGKKAKVVKNTANHNVTIGTIVTVTSCGGSYYYVREYPGYSFYLADLVPLSETKEDITSEINQYKKDIEELESKLSFIEETGSTEYDENVFKAYKTLKLVENKKLSTIEKAKLIGKLIEG